MTSRMSNTLTDPRGVVVLGVSADMKPVGHHHHAQEKRRNIDWPIDYDPSGFFRQDLRDLAGEQEGRRQYLHVLFSTSTTSSAPRAS